MASLASQVKSEDVHGDGSAANTHDVNRCCASHGKTECCAGASPGARCGLHGDWERNLGPYAAHCKEAVTLKPSLRAKRPLIVCVVGGQLRTTVPPPDGLCTFMIFEHVRVAKNSHDFVASSNQKAFDNFLKMAAGKKAEQFLLSLTSDLEYDESLEVGDRAEAIMRRYHDQNVCGYGFAHHRVLSTGIDSGKLWKHHSMLSNLRQWSKDPLVLFIGLEIFHHRSYSDVYVTGLLTEAAESMDFLILRVHVTTPPGLASRRCQVELISSWTKDTLNDKLLLTVEEATRVFNSSRLELNLTVPLLLSDSLAVVEYEVEKDPQAQRPRLLNLKCSKRTLQAFHTVCSSNFTYLRGARTKSTFCHYDDDPDNGRWRTYKTATDMTNERTKLSEPLDFHTERSRVTTVSSGVVHASEPPNPLVPIGNPLRPTLIRKRVAAAVPVPKNLQHWVYTVPWRRVIYVAVAVFVVVSIGVTGMFVAMNTGSKKPVCDEACMQYTTLLGESMDWSVAPCEDFHGFVCGKTKDNETSVRHLTNRHFVFAVLDIARHEEIPAEGQTAAQRAARLFKTCDDVVTQDTDYVPRLRGYMRDANLHWPQHPAERDANTVDVLSSMLELSEKWGWPCFLEFATEGVRDHLFELHVRPTIRLEEFQYNAINLGVGSPAHRKYFETLYAHYGGGVSHGVTFEEMLDYEAEIMGPLLSAYFLPPETFVYQRDPSNTSGLWERWTTTIASHYDLTENELVWRRFTTSFISRYKKMSVSRRSS
ncbi:uncharacterized protein LOC142817944 isoform X2 [Rhipicephalus microplus]|uniref:uncharacterized protein LOC142817944 isoform X2 n=1 Tax=Rhipicephalus microplus TaxID=6941 RepID=UPI003F6B138A